LTPSSLVICVPAQAQEIFKSLPSLVDIPIPDVSTCARACNGTAWAHVQSPAAGWPLLPTALDMMLHVMLTGWLLHRVWRHPRPVL
jgi:hypothetical protein